MESIVEATQRLCKEIDTSSFFAKIPNIYETAKTEYDNKNQVWKETRSQYFHKVGCNIRNVTGCLKKYQQVIIDPDFIKRVQDELALSTSMQRVGRLVVGKLTELSEAPSETFPVISDKLPIFLDGSEVPYGGWYDGQLNNDDLYAAEVFILARVTSHCKASRRTQVTDSASWMTNFINERLPLPKAVLQQLSHLRAAVVLDWEESRLGQFVGGLGLCRELTEALTHTLGKGLRSHMQGMKEKETCVVGDVLIMVSEVDLKVHGSCIHGRESDKMRFFMDQLVVENQCKQASTNLCGIGNETQEKARYTKAAAAFDQICDQQQQQLTQLQDQLEVSRDENNQMLSNLKQMQKSVDESTHTKDKTHAELQQMKALVADNAGEKEKMQRAMESSVAELQKRLDAAITEKVQMDAKMLKMQAESTEEKQEMQRVLEYDKEDIVRMQQKLDAAIAEKNQMEAKLEQMQAELAESRLQEGIGSKVENASADLQENQQLQRKLTRMKQQEQALIDHAETPATQSHGVSGIVGIMILAMWHCFICQSGDIHVVKQMTTMMFTLAMALAIAFLGQNFKHVFTPVIGGAEHIYAEQGRTSSFKLGDHAWIHNTVVVPEADKVLLKVYEKKAIEHVTEIPLKSGSKRFKFESVSVDERSRCVKVSFSCSAYKPVHAVVTAAEE